MKLKHTAIALAALFAALNTSHAQDLDPTVVVNKAYESKLVQVHKPSFEMEVPDSVTRFDLDFDYLVFEQPYKGADGFTPYVLNMKPAATVATLSDLYLNAGVGYTLHPTLDVVWSPLKSRVFPGWWQKGQPGRHAPADLQESRYPWCELAVEGRNL